MNEHIQRIKTNIEPYRTEIINHKVYSIIKDKEDLKIFMQYHIYAVWDFMSLLKSLQNNLTCTSVPWFPKGTPSTRFLINEIVVGEESDIDLNGNRKSHFELYLDAMNQCSADIGPIVDFIKKLKETNHLEASLLSSNTPIEAQKFVNFTFEIINSQKDYLQSAIFTFGREDLIPGMFVSLIHEIYKNFPQEISIFKYYIERHIEVDGDHHSLLAIQMTEELCGQDIQKWEEAEKAIIQSLKVRICLWDGVYNQLINKNHNL